MIKKMLLLPFLLLFLFLIHDVMAEETASPPIGQTESQSSGQGRIDADVFGQQGGYYHPFLLFEHQWTDNMYYTESSVEEDFKTSISPGIWLAFPANREKLLDIGTTTTAPGGLNISRTDPEASRKFQSYLYYAPEFVFYAENSQHDSVNQNIEGLLQYNFDVGLSINLIDRFATNHEPNNNGITDQIDKYRDNLASFLLTYETPERFKFRFDYSNYGLEYNDNVNSYMDRTDDSFALYAFYKIKPKTSVFLEYEFADIKYEDSPDSDSIENRYYAGLQWNVTAKTNGTIKLGYIEKNFDVWDAYDAEDFSLELQMTHNFSPKRALTLTGYRRFNESDMPGSLSFLTTGITAAWLQRFTERWSGTLQVSLAQDDYDGAYTLNDVTDKRTDDSFSIAPASRYKLRDWLIFDLGYIYRNRDSNFSIFDYTTNTIFFRMDIYI